ncbi:MAG TPA: alpha-L-rhamnosidase C-terminal domain-containing protein [Chthoniobacterales bacterium]
MQEAAQLADALGKADLAAGFTIQAAVLKTAINAQLFNPRTGLYDVSDAQRGVADQLGNAKAVLYGVTAVPDQASVLQKLHAALYRTPTAPNATGPVPVQQSSGSVQVGPFTSGFELWARFEAGDTAGALALIRNEWGLMRQSSPYYSGGAWEYVALDGTPGLGEGTSLAHGWSSAPTSALSKYVLGVRPVQPGYQTWLVEPRPGDLSWAAGTVPTPYGPIEVSWQNGAQGFRLEVCVPAGTCASVGVPVNAEGALLSDNGQTVNGVSPSNEPNGRASYLYLQGLKPGKHAVEVAGRKK